MKNCELCKEEFYPANSRSKICSKEHLVKCLNCENQFAYAKKKRFCSIKCGSVYQAKNTPLKTIQCSVCENTFESKVHNAKFCSNPHELKCAICGEAFEKKMPSKVKTCSSSCKSELTKRSNLERYGVENVFQSKEIKEKIKEDNLKKYGVEHNAQREDSREKQKKTNLERYGVEHPLQNKEILEKTKNTNLERYGVDNVGKSKEIQDKAKKTNLKKYGTEYSFQADEIKSKIKESNIKKYGVDHRLKNDSEKEKQRESTKRKYGVDNYSKTEDFKNKMKEISHEKYGTDYLFQSEEIKEKSSKTLKEKYGVVNAAQSPVIQDKMRKTNLERYGVENAMQNDEIKNRVSKKVKELYKVENITYSHMANIDDWLNIEKFLKSRNKETIYELSQYFNIHPRSVYRKLKKEKLLDLTLHELNESQREVEWRLFFESLGLVKGEDFLTNDRTVITPKELDFYFPKHNLGIEVSPIGTHFYSKETVWGGKTRDYHKNKFNEALNKEVELITILDWHDIEKLKDMLAHKLSKTSQKIPARKTKAIFIENDTSLKEFISYNHILGFRPYSMIGYSYLEYNGEIVGAAAFTKTKNPNIAELKRLVFRNGVHVQGGASKILKNFIKNNPKYETIVTLSDNDLGSGRVYSSIGFTKVGESSPQLNYYHSKEDFYIRRTVLYQQGTDRILKEFPNYEPVGLECKCEDIRHPNNECLPTAEQIVLNYGFKPLYDCGYTKWVYKV